MYYLFWVILLFLKKLKASTSALLFSKKNTTDYNSINMQ
ncbi:hypothetical protein PORCRE_940 [Porphyromonas crevioricanis JCM 15906]|uniref:Uncharacterized protein n=1 Tax=Porphyromonas crevioricanis JCM 15906 TaxID=1305617 RepID=T1DRG7_9PORP|nr:hypothetical protein PORCRE_940 [Porphyromonas crevioricanis JCM 15906]GAD07401.1 hypothetical protein PORCAN_1021 [Porphyromonas crevioricanis JCM 13913]